MTAAERKILSAALHLQSKASPITSRSLRHHADLAHPPALTAILSLCTSGHLAQISGDGPRHYRPERDLLGGKIDRGTVVVGGVTICPTREAMGYGWPPERGRIGYPHSSD